MGPYTFLGQLFGGHLTNSLTGIVLAQTFCAAPFLIVAARSAFGAVDPATLDMAATLGHSELSRFRHVALPLAAPGIRAGMVLAWLRAFGEYGAVIILAYHPFSLPVYTYNQFSGIGLPTTLAPTALALAVAAVVVIARPHHATAPHGSPRLVPAPDPPAAATPAPVTFDIDYRVGEFHLAVSHRSGGSSLAILGPSGSGKSALLRSLAGLNGRAPGPVWYGGRSVERIAVESRQVGYVAQGFSLYPHLTVWQHLLFAEGATPGHGRVLARPPSPRRTAGPLPGPDLGWSAPAGRTGPGPVSVAGAPPPRRAVLGARRARSIRAAPRAPPTAARDRPGHRVGHP